MRLGWVLRATVYSMTVLAGYGCMSHQTSSENNLKKYPSAQALIDQRQLNQDGSSAKEYAYASAANVQHELADVLTPRQLLGSYCQAQGGRFTIAYKSNLNAIKDSAAKQRLSKRANVKQAIGAYRCVIPNQNNWLVSIEPMYEVKAKGQVSYKVALLSKVMTEAEANRQYKVVPLSTEKNIKKPVNKAPAKESKETTKNKIEDKKEVPVVEVAKPAARVHETPQQQQTKLYVSARRDINAGKNVMNACNNAQRAYNYGKLQGTEGTRVYTESGMLVARCLTQIPSYANRFPNGKAQAKRVLQNLAQNYNHSGAKNMLKQLK
jgi:hypothetical protein